MDLDFSGNWRQVDAHIDPLTAKSQSGWVICFTGCLITWSLKLQTISALSTTEAEYIALSMSLHDIILLMGLLHEPRQHGFNILDQTPEIQCIVFEDNSSTLELAHLPKICPQTKHINQYFHHFREHVQRKEITLHATPMDHQHADMLNKPIPEEPFCCLRLLILGW